MKIAEMAREASQPYAPHLQVREVVLSAGKEWVPPVSGWTLIQVSGGTGYWMDGQSRVELAAEMLLLLAGDKAGHILASCLNGLALSYFTVMPERLSGLISQGELDFFQQATGRQDLAGRAWPADSPLAARMKMVCAGSKQGGLIFRLARLQVVVEIFADELEPVASEPVHPDVKERLRVILLELPPAGLLEISFEELAQRIHCTPRHLSRVFYEVAGMSFRDKRAEIRLAMARELLATSQSKVVDVAFKSGYKSLSLFNRMFTRRFGISPGRWRQKNGNLKEISRKTRLSLGAIRWRP